MQVRSWAWAMYRRSWTAYPAGRLTRTCPMPTTPLPPMARTHEHQHTTPCFPSLPRLHLKHLPPPLSSLPALSPSTPLHHKGAGRKRDVGEKEGWAHSFPSPSSFTLPSRRRTHPLFHYTPSHASFSFLHLPLLFLVVALRANICHCYIQDCLLHESKWV